MRRVTLWQYGIPMEAGVILRNQRLKQREGLVVRLQQGKAEGWGEIAPLPGFSHEDLPQAQREAERWLTQWRDGIMPPESELPSVAFGISCALAELDETLPLAANYHSALLCSGDPDELFNRLRALPRQVAKIKVGLYEAVRDGMIASLLLEALPDLILRLDANRSWTLAKARQFAGYIAPELRTRIAFIEEPCASREDSLCFARETGINIAWDESVHQTDFVLRAENGVSALVLKPMLIGSISKLQTLILRARQQGLGIVIGSSLESSIGLSQLARLAQALTPGATPGLDTLALMQHQLVRRWPYSRLPLQRLTEEQKLWWR